MFNNRYIGAEEKSQLGTQVDLPEKEEVEITQAGFEFEPGAQGNTLIERALGFESEVLSGRAHRRASNKGEEVNWTVSPDYCGDDTLAIDFMDSLCHITVMIMESFDVPGKKPKKKHVPMYVAVFDMNSIFYSTKPFEDENHAAACALWMALCIDEGFVSHAYGVSHE